MLTQPQRIELSKKIISVPQDIKTAQNTKQILDKEKAKLTEIDNANKSILDLRQPLIFSYQKELRYLDGITRTEFTEQDIVNAAKKVLGNIFFYNQLSTPTPSVSDGVWKNFPPFLKGFGIGKNYLEVYDGVVRKEGDIIDDLRAAIATLEGFHPMERATGQKVDVGPPQDIVPYPEVSDALNDVVGFVNEYKAFLESQANDITTTDFNTTRSSESSTALSNVNNLIGILNTWLAYPNFNTGYVATPATFYSYDFTLLEPTKGSVAQINQLKSDVNSRETFYGQRIVQLTNYLGQVNQSAEGEIVSQSGLYGERALALNLRINLINGSLSQLVGMENGVKAQEEIEASSILNTQAYDMIMKSKKFIAPSNGNNIIHISNSSDFAIGDTVYVCGDGQAELTGTVLNSSGTRVDLSFTIPKKYTPDNNSRLYKLI